MDAVNSLESGMSSDYELGLEFEDDLDDDADNTASSDRCCNDKATLRPSSPVRAYFGHRLAQGVSRRLFDVLTLDQVLESARSVVAETSDILGVDSDTAEFLLHQYKWQSSNLAQDWLDSPDKVLDKVGLPSLDKSIPPPPSSRTTFLCPVTVEEVPYSETDALLCGHRVSKNCWRSYLETAVASEGLESCVYKRCIMYQCGLIIPLMFWKSYLEPHSFQKYLEFRNKAIVGTDPKLRWCPGSQCGLIIKHHCGDLCDSSGTANVTCTCGEKFCFLCGDAVHSPATCSIALRWNEKNRSEAENFTWILANTKNCPGCKQPIEKNQGCMHMTCRCRYEFCWLCGCEWRKHQGADAYRCNVYEEKKSEKNVEEEQRLKAKETLERYTHYFERYRAHSLGEKVARERQLVEVKTLTYGLHKKFPLLMDNDFLENAVCQIIECRIFLKWSYAFAYFATWKNNSHSKVLFEDHQGELEKNLDRLQEVTEHFTLDQFTPHQYQEFLDFKTKLIDLTRVINSWFAKMSDALANDFVSQYE